MKEMIISALLFTVVFVIIDILMSWKNKIIFRLMNITIPLWDLIRVTFIVGAANIISPLKGAGFVIKPIIFKKRNGVAYKVTMTVTLIEQLIDILLQGSVALLSFYFISIEGVKSNYSLVYIILSVVIIYFIFFEKKTFSFLIGLIGLVEKIVPRKIVRFFSRKIKLGKDDFLNLLKDIQENKGKTKNLIKIMGIAVLMLLVSPFFVYTLFPVYAIGLSYLHAFIAYWLSFFVGRISGSPGGLGVREGAIVLILAAYGIDAVTATKLAILFRVLQIILSVVFGIISASVLKINILKIKKLQDKNV